MISKKAFSLVEMLVAVVILTLLIGVAIFSFKHQLIAISKTKKIAIDKAITFKQLKSSLESMTYYVVNVYDTLNQPMKDLNYYFKGTKKEVMYITQSPLFSTEDSVVQLKCDDEKLLYKEEKLYGRIDFLRPSLLEDSRELIMYNDLSKCEIQYYINNEKKDNLQNILPDAVEVKIELNNESNDIYVKVKNDNNTSIDYVYFVLYGEE